MPNQIQVIALIPARGGSQELPRKNIRPLAGKPLITWTIEAAKYATSIDRVFVSTEDPEIRKIALNSGAEVIDRPLELASHTASLEPVISHAIEVLKSRDIKFSHLCLLQPTSPLRTCEHIDKAVEILANNSVSGVISVTQSDHSATKAYRQNKDGTISGLFTVDAPYARRQDLPESYFANGAIYLFSHEAFALNQQIPREKMLPYLMPSEISHDIDNLSDFEAIERQITHSHPHKIRPLNINGRLVGPEHPPLVIAEIGINHEGSLKTALEMVDAAHSAGAEVIKHQTHIVDDEMSMAAKKTIPGNTDVSIYEVMERCALTEEEELELKKYVEEKGMIFMSTPFSRAAANRLNRMGVAAIKIGSGECNNLPLIEHIAQFGLPMIVSTGMNSTESVKATVQILEKHNANFALLHTTNLYPTPSHLVRLGAMQELQKTFPHVNVGLSDHTDSNLACIAAMSLGATIVERHFTDHMERQGPDIVNSMDTQSLKELLAASRVIPQMLGGTKQAAQEESVTMRFAFSTLVATKNIKKGDHFTVDNIWAKRPGTGEIPAAEYQATLGKLATVDIPSDTHIARNMIDEP